MTASDPRDPAIALVGEGFGLLLVARRLGLDNREVGRLRRSDRPDAVPSATPGAARIR